MPKLLNPNHASAAEQWAQANKGVVQTWLAAPAQASMREISFDHIRANVPAMAARTDGELHELCKALGLTAIA